MYCSYQKQKVSIWPQLVHNTRYLNLCQSTEKEFAFYFRISCNNSLLVAYHLRFIQQTRWLKQITKSNQLKTLFFSTYALILEDSPTTLSIPVYQSPIRVCCTISLPDLRCRMGLRTPKTARSAKLGFDPPV